MSDEVSVPEFIEPRQLGLGNLFDHVRDAVVVGEAGSGRIVLWNAAAETLFGYTREEAFGLLIEDLVPPELKAQHRRGISRYAREGHGELIDSGALIELPALHKDGTSRTVEFTLTPVERSNVPGRFALAILRDVTSRHELQRRLEESEGAAKAALAQEQDVTRQLREIDELRAIFTAVLAHDVRSPMTAVQGFAEHLIKHGDEMSAEDRTDALQMIVRSADRVVRLSEDVLLVSAIEAGSVPISLGPVVVADAIAQATDPLDSIEEPTRFESDIERGLVVTADPHRLWQVLTNVLTNALKNSPPGESVEIAARRCDRVCEITVRDHGPGIAPQQRTELFQRFSRLGPAGGIGSGLGLYICHQLLNLMDGEIAISDTAGPGSTFTIRLPIAT
jgi:two-component system sensor histidine kinase/response regulator